MTFERLSFANVMIGLAALLSSNVYVWIAWMAVAFVCGVWLIRIDRAERANRKPGS